MSSMDVPADRPAEAPAARVGMVKPTYITWLTLAFMTTVSVARSERVLPVALNLQGASSPAAPCHHGLSANRVAFS